MSQGAATSILAALAGGSNVLRDLFRFLLPFLASALLLVFFVWVLSHGYQTPHAPGHGGGYYGDGP